MVTLVIKKYMKHLKIITALLILGFYGFGQNVTPDPGPYSPLNQKYIYRWVKTSGGIWNLGKFVQEDSAQFKGVTYVPNAPDGDSSTRAANTEWIKRNISPGVPGTPTAAWNFSGNYGNEFNRGVLGFRDSNDLSLYTNGIQRLSILAAGIKRSASSANKVLIMDTITKAMYYTDMASGGGSIDTTNLHARGVAYYRLEADSAVLVLNDSSRYRVKVGGGSDIVKETHTTGATKILLNATTWLIVNPNTIIPKLSITLPTLPRDGQDVVLSFGGTITGGNEVVTALSITPSPIESSTPSYIESGESIKYRYNSTNSKWYRQ